MGIATGLSGSHTVLPKDSKKKYINKSKYFQTTNKHNEVMIKYISLTRATEPLILWTRGPSCPTCHSFSTMDSYSYWLFIIAHYIHVGSHCGCYALQHSALHNMHCKQYTVALKHLNISTAHWCVRKQITGYSEVESKYIYSSTRLKYHFFVVIFLHLNITWLLLHDNLRY